MSEPLHPCERCQTSVPHFNVDERAFESVQRALSNGSPTLAAAELKHYVSCSDSEAQAWVGHLLSCAYAWPTVEEDERILRNIEQAFAGVAKPEHFTDYTHCDECKEHDDTLRARTLDTLQRGDLGNSGWDPITFSSTDGIGYFFPALARFALLPSVWRDRDWYGVQLISHLSYERGSNRFLAWCSPKRRRAVHEFLQHLQTTRASNFRNYGAENSLISAVAIWAPPAGPR